VSIFDLLHSLLGDNEFFGRCLVVFLDELMQDDKLFARSRCSKRPGDTFRSLKSQLKQAIPHRTGVGHSKIRSVDFSFDLSIESNGQESHRQS